MTTRPMARSQPLAIRSLELLTTPAAVVTCSYLAALAGAEILLVNAGLIAGALAHAALLAALIGHYVAASKVGYRRLLLALALPSLMRMVGLAVPISSTSPENWRRWRVPTFPAVGLKKTWP